MGIALAPLVEPGMDDTGHEDGEDDHCHREQPDGLKALCSRAWANSGWASIEEDDAFRARLSCGERSEPTLVRLFHSRLRR